MCIHPLLWLPHMCYAWLMSWLQATCDQLLGNGDPIHINLWTKKSVRAGYFRWLCHRSYFTPWLPPPILVHVMFMFRKVVEDKWDLCTCVLCVNCMTFWDVDGENGWNLSILSSSQLFSSSHTSLWWVAFLGVNNCRASSQLIICHKWHFENKFHFALCKPRCQMLVLMAHI